MKFWKFMHVFAYVFAAFAFAYGAFVIWAMSSDLIGPIGLIYLFAASCWIATAYFWRKTALAYISIEEKK